MSQESLQYIAVFFILAAVIAWIVVRIVKKKPGSSSCSGCSLADSCNSKQRKGKTTEKNAVIMNVAKTSVKVRLWKGISDFLKNRN